MASVLIISWTHYKILESTIKAKTDEYVSMFVDTILDQINHLDIILTTTKQILTEKHLAIAKSIDYMLKNVPGDLTTEHLRELAEPLDIIELSIADKNGIITNSSVPKYIGFDYKAREITARYMAITDGTIHEISEEPRESVFEDDMPGEINHYVGIAHGEGFIQIGFNAAVITRLQHEINIERNIAQTRIGDNGYGMVLESGVITAHPDEHFLMRNVSGEDWYPSVSSGNGFEWIKIDGEIYYARYKSANDTIVVGLVPEADYYRELRKLRTETSGLLVFVIILMALVVYFILGRLLRPVNHLAKALNEIARGNLDTRIEGSYNNEFDTIKDAVNAMLADIKTYMDDKLSAQRMINDLNTSIMLSQIQPHFLYNSLVVIRQLCREDPKRAEETIVEFAQYLRGNLDSLTLKHPISFEQELGHTQTYLAIEQKRFGCKLKVIYNIQFKDFSLPALTLQPVVENAVRHGVTHKEHGGTVTITVDEADGNAVITVVDDGVGFDPMQTVQSDGRSHIGLENVRSRLAAFCGGKLEIHSKSGVGTSVVITIPKEH